MFAIYTTAVISIVLHRKCEVRLEFYIWYCCLALFKTTDSSHKTKYVCARLRT